MATTNLDLNSFDNALKEHYTKDRVENMVYMDNALLALVAKMEDAGGRGVPIPIIFGNSQNRSADIVQALAGTTTSLVEQFFLTRVKDYSVASLDNETMKASKGDANAFLDATTFVIDGALNVLTRSLAVKMYRDGFGSIGQVNATVTGTTLTLLNPNDIVNFEKGQVLQFSASSGSDALRDAGDTVTVSAVNRSDGSMTVGTLSGIAGLVSGDYIFLKGDRQDSATPSRVVVAGLEAWCPATAPSATLFFTVDRTSDLTRLGGLRLNVTTMPIEEMLIEGASLVAREGGKIDHYLMSYATFSALEKALGAKVQYVDVKMNAEIGFRGIMINGPRGPIKVIPDQNCPSNRVFGIKLSSWKLYSLGKAVGIIEDGAGSWLRQSAADANEVRCGFYGNLGCNAPGHNICLFSTNISIS